MKNEKQIVREISTKFNRASITRLGILLYVCEALRENPGGPFNGVIYITRSIFFISSFSKIKAYYSIMRLHKSWQRNVRAVQI